MPNGNLEAVVRKLASGQHEQSRVIQEIVATLKAQSDTPKWIESIPGRRVPYFAAIDLNLPANSTSKQEGIHNVSTDGPFVVTAIAMFYRKTSGAYAGVWGYATAANSKIDATGGAGATGQQHGFLNIFDQPHVTSGDWEITDRGSDRNWQNREISSALMNASAGGAYVLPTANIFGRNSTINATFTPNVAVPHTGQIQVLMLGYKIVQGDVYQP